MVPQTVRFEIKATAQVVVLSDPLFLAASVEETPYQWLRLCDAAARLHTLPICAAAVARRWPVTRRWGSRPINAICSRCA